MADDQNNLSMIEVMIVALVLTMITLAVFSPSKDIYARSDPYSGIGIPIQIICVVLLIPIIGFITKEVYPHNITTKSYIVVSLAIFVLFGVVSLLFNRVVVSPLPWYKGSSGYVLVDSPNFFYYLDDYFISAIFGGAALFALILGVGLYKERIEASTGRSIPFYGFLAGIAELLEHAFKWFDKPKYKKTVDEKFLESEEKLGKLSEAIERRIEQAIAEGKPEEYIDLLRAKGQQELEKMK